MKETGTGYIRRIANPNVRLQDSAKQYLLCRDCEQRFSVAEGYFSTHVFKPFLTGSRSIEYDNTLTYFTVSLLWRTLERERNTALAVSDSHRPYFDEAQNEWRDFLKGEGNLERFNHLHVFITDLVEKNPPGVPNFNLYCSRALDVTFFELDGRCYVLSKFG